jgi:23S rRNA (pseudouridine1915-N3)-methyltransferase
MQIEIWSLGKENDSFIEEGIQYYFKKIRFYHPVELVLLQTQKKVATTDVERTRMQEEELILRRLQPHHFLVLLDEKGKDLNSIQWSQQFQQFLNQGVKTLVLLIGGSYGVTDVIKRRANLKWSLSPLVFPHQLVRLILAEQLYRGISILNNLPYHHGDR